MSKDYIPVAIRKDQIIDYALPVEGNYLCNVNTPTEQYKVMEVKDKIVLCKSMFRQVVHREADRLSRFFIKK